MPVLRKNLTKKPRTTFGSHSERLIGSLENCLYFIVYFLKKEKQEVNAVSQLKVLRSLIIILSPLIKGDE